MKKINSFSALVYSTDPDFKPEKNEEEQAQTLPSSHQKIKVISDKKNRAGKIVTLVTGFTGRQEDLEQLGKQLRTFCGTGGSAKDGEIIVQGDNIKKVLQWLHKNGYPLAK